MVSGGSWWARGMAGTGHPSRPSMIRQVPVAVATSLPVPSVISARAKATRRPGLVTRPVAKIGPLGS